MTNEMLTRRGVLRSVALAIAPFPQPAAGSAFRGLELNHIAFRVSDPEKTAVLYDRMLGATRIDAGPKSARFLAIGPHTVNLFRGQRPGFDHVCFTVSGYEPGRAAALVKGAGLEPIVEEDRVFFLDPDGLQIQVGEPFAGGQRRP
jgi:catechol 2,3-dioxygenase-like lactoylglutathione lyase family enzyme